MKAPKSIIEQVRQWERTNRYMVRTAKRAESGGITAPKVSAAELVALLYENGGSSLKVAKLLGIASTNVAQRRLAIEQALKIELPRGRPEIWKAQSHRRHIKATIDNGTILIGSDAHCWPETYGTAMAAFVDFGRKLKPDFTILNGDGLDGAKVSRHSRIGWDQRPSVKEELDALTDFLDQVLKSNPNSKRMRTQGNHDVRFDTYLSSHAPEVEGARGTSLEDHIPGWTACMSIEVNGNCVIQHRYRSGVHAVWNNVRDYGCHIITGHNHRQTCRPWSNRLGTWYGVDAGMLAPVSGPQFDYTEQERPQDWRSGFVILTFKDGNLMPPELAMVTNEEAGELYFRGQLLRYEL